MVVLQDGFESKRRGKPVYLRKMTGIGPSYTEELEEAEQFDTKEAALNSPAYRHSMCFFEPVEL